MMSVEVNKAIVQEFRQALTTETEVNLATQAVVVLSIRPPHFAENRERLNYGWELARRVAAARCGGDPARLSQIQITNFAPTIIINGERELLPDLFRLAISLGIPESKIELLDSGPLDQCNTKTNMQALAQHPVYSLVNHLSLVTSGYHVPRVQRTAARQLGDWPQYSVHPVPHGRFEHNVTARVLAEIKRIKRYSQQGDIESLR